VGYYKDPRTLAGLDSIYLVSSRSEPGNAQEREEFQVSAVGYRYTVGIELALGPGNKYSFANWLWL